MSEAARAKGKAKVRVKGFWVREALLAAEQQKPTQQRLQLGQLEFGVFHTLDAAVTPLVGPDCANLLKPQHKTTRARRYTW
jgi:hypothetical protein